MTSVEIQVRNGKVTIRVGGQPSSQAPNDQVVRHGNVGDGKGGDGATGDTETGGDGATGDTETGGGGPGSGVMVIGPVVVPCCSGKPAGDGKGGDGATGDTETGGDGATGDTETGGAGPGGCSGAGRRSPYPFTSSSTTRPGSRVRSLRRCCRTRRTSYRL
jgi:hypothetical protein